MTSEKETCATCGGSLHVPYMDQPVFLHTNIFCSHICERWGGGYHNRETPSRAPQTPSDIRARLVKYYEYYDLPHQTRVQLLEAKWREERYHRTQWNVECNEAFAEHKKTVLFLESEHLVKEQQRAIKHHQTYGTIEGHSVRKFVPPNFQPPSYEQHIEFPYSIFEDPEVSFSKEQSFRRHNPKCNRGFIHHEYEFGKAFPCNFSHTELNTENNREFISGNWYAK